MPYLTAYNLLPLLRILLRYKLLKLLLVTHFTAAYIK